MKLIESTKTTIIKNDCMQYRNKTNRKRQKNINEENMYNIMMKNYLQVKLILKI